MTRTSHTPLGGQSWLVRRVADAAILAAGIVLALPLIVPFA